MLFNVYDGELAVCKNCGNDANARPLGSLSRQWQASSNDCLADLQWQAPSNKHRSIRLIKSKD
ncbi:hypothetical protein TIFTF001_022413 [Ficus carica]|uniref:Uncharacterized protein n=1 Tax=Ficus carica TaxID=3494 RepID=A0AA88DJZ7_FICCA|nr:hypothetical protein TIFTF001_022413 [Ficus carica]